MQYMQYMQYMPYMQYMQYVHSFIHSFIHSYMKYMYIYIYPITALIAQFQVHTYAEDENLHLQLLRPKETNHPEQLSVTHGYPLANYPPVSEPKLFNDGHL